MTHDRNYDTIGHNDPKVPFSYMISRTIPKEDVENLRIPRWHEQMELKLILTGQAEVSCGSVLFLASPGDLVVINSCELHGITPVGTEELSYHLLMISPSQLYGEQIGSTIPEGRLRLKNCIRGNERLWTLFMALFAELAEKNESYELAAVGYISLLFAELLRNHRLQDAEYSKIDDLSRYAAKLEPAFRLIGDRYAGDLNLDMLAQACEISVYHFCRMFRQVTGETVVNYLNEYRIGKAQLLLESTELPILDIAHAVGFKDNGYFTQRFRKHRGMTPSEYRAKVLSDGVHSS